MRTFYCSLAVLLAAFFSAPAFADVIAREDFDGGDLNLNSFTTNNFPAGGFTSLGDGFGVYTRLVSTTIPFNITDDSDTGGAAGSSSFPNDNNGPVNNAKNNDGVFGITDTWNNDTSDGGGGFNEVSGTWSFDISSGTGPLQVSIDMVAMNDFAGSTVNSNVDFFYQIDGGGYLPLFTSSISVGDTETYTMDDGDMFTYDDPLNMTTTNSQTYRLNNVFQTITSGIAGTGTTLEIQVRVNMDGSEAVAFDNISVNSVPEPSALGLLGLIGLVGLRRFRKVRR